MRQHRAAVSEPSLPARPASESEADDEPPAGDEPPIDDDVAAIEAWQRAQERSRRKAQVQGQPADRPPDAPAGARPATRVQAPPNRLRPTMAVDLDERRPHRVGAPPRPGWPAASWWSSSDLVGYLFVALARSQTERQRPATAIPGVAPDPETRSSSLTVGADVAPASIEQLARCRPCSWSLLDDERGGRSAPVPGSSWLDRRGMILTNAHVRDQPERPRTRVPLHHDRGRRSPVDSSSPAELLYRAEVDQLPARRRPGRAADRRSADRRGRRRPLAPDLRRGPARRQRHRRARRSGPHPRLPGDRRRDDHPHHRER